MYVHRAAVNRTNGSIAAATVICPHCPVYIGIYKVYKMYKYCYLKLH